MNHLLGRTGARICLGEKLGAGGEGAVFVAPSAGPNIVAKIYHKRIPEAKQRKLTAMVKAVDKRLLAVACWPIDTVHDGRTGAICGFLMHRMAGHVPLHDLYGPSSRKQQHPDKDWAFLVNVARNTAASFEAIHAHGHVIGDVNPNLVHVAQDSTVKLIDCDSFQVRVDGAIQPCEVGVSHFTPPELQGLRSFRDVLRSPNHDAFGLALLVFHLLLMGRHPFSGVCNGGADSSLENNIAHYRYVFGPNASAKGIKPPPRSVSPSILPPSIAAYFERAFTENGGRAPGRPDARYWVAALDQLRSQLRACGHERSHKYFVGLTRCPWCEHEDKHASIFFVTTVASLHTIASFNLDAIWRKICAVTSPGPAPRIDASTISVTPRPLPEPTRSRRIPRRIGIMSVVVVVGVALMTREIAIISAAFLYSALVLAKTLNHSQERKIRTQARNLARSKMLALERQWTSEAAETEFQRTLAELGKLRGEYIEFNRRFAEERGKLGGNLRALKLRAFLDGIHIKHHSIRSIGPARKAALASFGVETAADIDRSNIIRIPGFGPSLTQELLSWRRTMEQRFVFDPAVGVNPADLAALNRRFAKERRRLEGALLAGPERLNVVKTRILERRSALRSVLVDAMKGLRQAEVDLEICRR